MGAFAEVHHSVDGLYAATRLAIREGLLGSDRLAGRPILTIWLDWVDLLFEGRRRLVLPPVWFLGHELRAAVPSFCFATVAGRLLTPPWASWL